jgi:hypothetical protein
VTELIKQKHFHLLKLDLNEKSRLKTSLRIWITTLIISERILKKVETFMV